MPFSDDQRESFISAIQTHGWNLEGDTIFSQGRGLWFSPSHFADWSPAEMHDIFERRAKRIETAKVGDRWERSAIENRQVYKTIEELGWMEDTA